MHEQLLFLISKYIWHFLLSIIETPKLVNTETTMLAQYQTYSGSTSCAYWAANTNRHPNLEPALRMQQQLTV